MNRLLRDYLHRYAVLLAIIGGVMIMFPFMQVEGVVISTFWMIIGTVTVIIEQSTGATRVKTAMPIPRNDLAKMAWIQSVVVFPLLYACVSYPILAVRALTGHADASLFAFQLTAPAMGMGISAMVFLLLPWLWPTPGSFFEQARAFAVIVGYIVFLVAYDLMFLSRTEASESLYRLLLRQEHTQVVPPGPVHLKVVVVIAVALAIATFITSRRILDSMPLRPKTPDSTTERSVAVLPSRTAGFLAPWMREASRAAVFTLALAGMFAGLVRLFQGLGVPAGDEALVFAMVLPMLFIPILLLPAIIGPWVGCIRALRMLPMSRARLTAILLSFFAVAMTIACLGVFLLARDAGNHAPFYTTLNYTILFLGWGCPCLALLVRFGGVGTLLAITVLWGIPTLLWTSYAHDGTISVAIDLAMSAAALTGVAMLYRVIGHSSGACSRKPLFEDGPFGQP